MDCVSKIAAIIEKQAAKRQRRDETRYDPANLPAREPPPTLPGAEEPLAIPQGSAKIDGRAPAEHDRHRVRQEGGEKEPQGLQDRLEGHRGRRRFVTRI